jgi:protoporphyrinogen/coproporphyrinogen III oxidase
MGASQARAPILIVGGGITGLAAAWEVQRQGVPYTLVEASPRLGGKIVTERVAGFTIEAAADSFLVAKPWAWQLCREIGLGERLMGTNPERRNVYVYRHGRLHLMPRGLRLIVPTDPDGLLESDLLSDAGKRRMLAEPEVPPRADTGDESLADFVGRRFGPEAVEVFGESLLAGIHVADPARLSMAATFPQFPRLERTHGSVTRGLAAATAPPPDPAAPAGVFVSLRGGMDELIAGLAARLTGDIRLNTALVGLDGAGRATLADGSLLSPAAVILTVPARAAAEVVATAAPGLAARLAGFRTVDSGTVSLGYRADEVGHPLDGYGFVIPTGEGTRIRAATWSSTKLPGRAPEGHVLLRVFVGGHGREADVGLSDADLFALAREQLHLTMGIGAEPVVARAYRWRAANPQYDVGHLDRVAAARRACPPWLALAGCAYEGVGIPDCVRQGREAARQVAAALTVSEGAR